MNPLSLTILLSCVVGVLFLSKRKAALAFLIGTVYISQSESLEIVGFLFFPTRILGIVGFTRILIKREFHWPNVNNIDKALLILYLYTTVILIIRPSESIPLRIAKATDIIFCYFSFRALIITMDDLRWLLQAVLILLIPYTLLLSIEFFRHSHPFAIFGLNRSIWLREGHPRCFGTFRHPSLLGSLGATFLPLYIALFWDERYRKYSILGTFICLLIVFFSNSGGPLSVAAMAIAGWFFWPLRYSMKRIRYLVVGTLCVLALLMKAPIWYLLVRLSSVTGGTGWHRAYLIDVAYRHIKQWWLAGLPLTETYGWFSYTLAATGGADVTNQFISFALNGGIVSLFLFVWFIYRVFSLTGKALRHPGEPADILLLWGLGCVMASHVANWFGITYWDQFYVIFLFHVAAASSIYSTILNTQGDSITESREGVPPEVDLNQQSLPA